MPAYKNKERNTWYCSFYYEDWTGKRKKKKKEGFKTQREAKAYERKFLEKAQANPDMTFESLIEQYMKDSKTRLKHTTYVNKKCLIDTKILPYFKDTAINKIEPSSIRQWQNTLINHENGYSQTYLKTVNNQLSAIFNYAIKYYKLPSNPVRLCGSIGKKHADKFQFWTREEFQLFIPTVSDKPTSKVLFNLLFWTGMRVGELLALTLNDFDFNNKVVSVNKSFVRLGKKDIIGEPKTPKSKRIITIPDFLCEMVKEYFEKSVDYNPNERLIQISRHYIRTEMERGCKISNVKKIRVHDLRHSHASLLIEEGFSPLLISERLGHENIETTLHTYSHLYPNKHSEVAERLEDIAKIST